MSTFEAMTRRYSELDRVKLGLVWNAAITQAYDLIRAQGDSLGKEQASAVAALDDAAQLVLQLRVQVIEAK
jgi:hypothetical protein